jgi:alkyl hydroperoxide reductase subunit AhpC
VINPRQIWIRFDESDRRTPAPQFELETLQGRRIALSDFRGDQNLVLYFAPLSGGEARLASELEAFARREADYRLHEARVLAILPDNQPSAFRPASVRADGDPVPLLILRDPFGATRKAYAAMLDASLVSDDDSLLYILDRFGAPYAAQAAGQWDQPQVQAGILDWLDFIGMLCPE